MYGCKLCIYILISSPDFSHRLFSGFYFIQTAGDPLVGASFGVKQRNYKKWVMLHRKEIFNNINKFSVCLILCHKFYFNGIVYLFYSVIEWNENENPNTLDWKLKQETWWNFVLSVCFIVFIYVLIYFGCKRLVLVLFILLS